MASASEILDSPEYKSANLETKQAIFDKHVGSTPDYQNANEDTKKAIHEKFGLDYKSTKSFEDVSKSFYEKQSKPSTTETIFGKGLGPEATWEERLGRVATAAATGGMIGTAIEPGGGTAVGMVAGAGGEVAEQVLGALGAPRGAQVAGGILSPLIAGKIATETGKLGLGLLDYLKPENLMVKGLRAIGKDEGPAVVDFRNAQTAAAKQRLAGPEAFKASEQFGAGLLENVGARQARAARLAKQAERTKGTVESDLLRQQTVSENNYTRELTSGPGGARPAYQVGTELRQEIQAVQDPIYRGMLTTYHNEFTAAMDAAKASESKGQFWASTPEALAVRDKWKAIAKDSSDPIKKEINAVLDDIWKPGEEILDVFNQPTGKRGFNYLPSVGVDQVIRRLGEAGFKDVEGYAAIKGDLSKKLRADIVGGVEKEGTRTGGFYSWSGLGEAKGNYAKSLEDLTRFESTRGQAVLGTQQGVDLSKLDAEKVPKMMLGSESGFKELIQMLGDPARAKEYAKQYARNELVGMNAQKSAQWAKDHAYLGPDVTKIATDHANKLSSLENNSKVLEGIRTDKSVKPWSDNVDKFSKRLISDLNLGTSGIQTDPGAVIGKLLSGDSVKKQVEAASYYLSKNPDIKAKLPSAVADYMSKQSVGTMLDTWTTKVRPALEGAQLVSTQELNRIESGVKDIIAASKARPIDPTFKQKLSTYLIDSFGPKAIQKGAKKTARQAGSIAATGQSFDLGHYLLDSDTKK